MIGNSGNLFFHGFLLINYVSIPISTVGHGAKWNCPHLCHRLFCCISCGIAGGSESYTRIWKGVPHCIFCQYSDGFEYCLDNQFWSYWCLEGLYIWELYGVQVALLETTMYKRSADNLNFVTNFEWRYVLAKSNICIWLSDGHVETGNILKRKIILI